MNHLESLHHTHTVKNISNDDISDQSMSESVYSFNLWYHINRSMSGKGNSNMVSICLYPLYKQYYLWRLSIIYVTFCYEVLAV